MTKGLLIGKGLLTRVSSGGGGDSAMTEDATIIATTKAAIEAAINALPNNMGQYTIFLQYPDGSSASDFDYDIDVQDKYNGTFVIEAENALSGIGTNQPVEFIFDDLNKRINFINCNITVIRDSIKFTGVAGAQTVFVDSTNSKLEWIDRFCYDDCEACDQDTIVLHGFSAVSNDGSFQGAADMSNTTYCSLQNELNENQGGQISIIDCARNTIPFKYAGAGAGSLIVSGSNSACEEDAPTLDLIPLTSHTWDPYTPATPLTAPTAGTPVVNSGSSVTVPISGIDVNADSVAAYYKLNSSGTWIEAATGLATSITEYDFNSGLTENELTDFSFIAEGSGSYSNSPRSNVVSATPVSTGYGDDLVLEITTASPNYVFTLPAHNTGTYNAVIDWGDGEPTSTITAFDDPDLVHTYTNIGVYELKISGTFPRLYFNNTGSRAVVTGLLNWGNVGSDANQSRAYWGCNIPAMPTDAGAINFFNNILTDGSFMMNATDVTSIPSGYTLETVINASFMFQTCLITNVAATVTFAAANDLTSIFSSSTIATADYSTLLVNIEANNTDNNTVFGAGSSMYNATGEIARNALLARTPTGWTITDGGLEI